MEVWQCESGFWHWRMISAAGRTLVYSTEPHGEEWDAIREVKRARERLFYAGSLVDARMGANI